MVSKADEEGGLPTCFMAMPITTQEDQAERYGDSEHWLHVREVLFERAIKAAGYEPIVPEAVGAFLIHERIVKNLEECDLVLVDLSAFNPNVLFELGVRTSLNKPISLVWDGIGKLPFDTSGINTPQYDSALNAWDVEREVEKLRKHIVDSVESCEGQNPLWRQFALKLTASAPQTGGNATEAKLDLLVGQLPALQHEIAALQLQNEQLMRQNSELQADVDRRRRKQRAVEMDLARRRHEEGLSGQQRLPGISPILNASDIASEVERFVRHSFPFVEYNLQIPSTDIVKLEVNEASIPQEDFPRFLRRVRGIASGSDVDLKIHAITKSRPAGSAAETSRSLRDDRFTSAQDPPT